MYVFAFHIKHFRSFESLWGFPNDSMNLTIGPNNCGKSSVIRAIALVLDPKINYQNSEPINRFDFFEGDTSTPIEITIWLKPKFTLINDSPQYLEDDNFKASFFGLLSNWKIESVDREFPDRAKSQNYSHPDSLIPINFEGIEEARKANNLEHLLAIKLVATWDSELESVDTKVEVIDEDFNNIKTFSKKMKNLIGSIFIPCRRDPVRELSFYKQSLLARSVDEDEVDFGLKSLLKHLESNKDVLLTQNSVSSLLKLLNENIPNELLSLIELGDNPFSFTFLGGDLWRLRGATSLGVKVNLDSPEFILPLDYQGAGAQNLVMLAYILRLLETIDQNSIVFLEEPEQNLDPSTARYVFTRLANVANSKDFQLKQVFLTTHSPHLVNDILGTESLLLFHEENRSDILENNKNKNYAILAPRYLRAEVKKSIDQNNRLIVDALFSRQVLLVEGDSEIGIIPVFFNYFDRIDRKGNPFHLGLELLNGNSKQNLINLASKLRVLGKSCHILYDFDISDSALFKEELNTRFDGVVDYISSWPDRNLLTFAEGCDLEIILSALVKPENLFDAIKVAYGDPGHELKNYEWDYALKQITDKSLVSNFPKTIDLTILNNLSLSDQFTTEEEKRAFLLALLHGPHSCKAVRDMRIIGERLVELDDVPKIFDNLRIRALQAIIKPTEFDHGNVHLSI